MGIITAEHLGRPSFLPPLLFLLLLSGSFLSCKRYTPFKLRWIPGLTIYAVIFSFGYLLCYQYNEINHPHHFNRLIQDKNYLVGIVNSQPKQVNDNIRLTLSARLINGKKNRMVKCAGNLQIYLSITENRKSVGYGDQLIIYGQIVEISPSKNPTEFDYRRFLHYKNIHFQAFVQKDQWQRLNTSKGSFLYAYAHQLNKHFTNVINKYVPARESKAVLSALVLGNKDELTDQIKTRYADTGAIHILAVSGLHVGIISGFFFVLLNRLPWSNYLWQIVKVGINVLLIWCFALITGLSESVQRASFMFTAFHTGSLLKRTINSYNSVAIAAFCILSTNPFALFDIGFQLSFSAVFGILFFTPKILALWQPRQKWFNTIWKITVVSFSAQMGVLPISIYYFHQFPIFFWLTGLFVIPLSTFILVSGIALLISSYMNGILTGTIGWLIHQVISTQNFLIQLIQQIPFHRIDKIWINITEFVILYTLILFLALLLLNRQIKWFRYFLIGLACLFIYQADKKYQQLKQKKIIIYSINGGSAIDFMDGQTLYSLQSLSKDKKFATKTIHNNRERLGIEEIVNVNKEKVQFANFYKKGNMIQFYDKRLAIIDASYPTQNTIFTPGCDFVVLVHNPTVNLSDLKKTFLTDKLIADGSNSKKNINEWKKYSSKTGLNFFDAKNGRAFIVNF